jgi:hypothetical protein
MMKWPRTLSHSTWGAARVSVVCRKVNNGSPVSFPHIVAPLLLKNWMKWFVTSTI